MLRHICFLITLFKPKLGGKEYFMQHNERYDVHELGGISLYTSLFIVSDSASECDSFEPVKV